MILLCTGLILSVTAVKAQPNAGLKGGVNYTSLSGYEGDRRLSFHAGFFVEIPLSKKWTVQPELLYSGEGQHYILSEGGEGTQGEEKTITLGYVSLPVMLRVSLNSKFYLEAGPQFAVLAVAHSKGFGIDGLNVKRSFKNSQLGLNMGTGISLSQQIGLYGRYYFGMTDITPYDNNLDRSQAAQLGIAIRLSKQKSAVKQVKKVK